MLIRDPGKLKGSININIKVIVVGNITHELDFMGVSSIFLDKYWHIKWDKVTEIKFIVKIDYSLSSNDMFESVVGHIMQNPEVQKNYPTAPGTGHYNFSTTWLVNYGKDGVTFDPQGAVDLGSISGSGGVAVAVEMAQNQNAHEADAAFVSLLIKLKGGYSSDGISFGVYGVGISGIGASGSSFSRDFPLKVFLYATDRPNKEKQVEITDDLLSSSVYFEKNKYLIDRSSLGDLADWVKSLQGKAPNLTKAIKSGKVTITLSGYASTLGSTKINDNISQERIGSLEKEIKRKFDSEAIRINPQPHGKRDAKQKGDVPAEMRVDIKLDRAEATKAVQERGL